MKRMEIFFKLVCTVAIIASCALVTAGNETQNTSDHYWEWGVGITNISGMRHLPLDVARYDWSIIDLGNIPVSKETLVFLNRILEINPKHKFLLRVWPIIGLGKCPENRYQMTMFDYFYRDGIKSKMLQKTKEQIEYFMKGLTNSGNIAGICFLEELPCHISSSPWNSWKPGTPIPWDIKAFEKEIRKELGTSFDMMLPEHRLWWGKKYVQLLDDVHRMIKEASGGKRIIYWHQSAMIGTLDELKKGDPMIDQLGHSPVPIYYKDVVIPGVCDGIFGYPGNGMEERCVIPAEKLNCLYFSQISFPAFMRRLKWDETLNVAMKKDCRNLGTVIHGEKERGVGGWNQLPWFQKNFTRADNFRMFALLNNIGMGIIEKELKPDVKLDYKINGVKQGDFVHVFVQIFNPVSPSWYGGDIDRATMKDLNVKLQIPDGFDLPQSNSAPPLIKLGTLKPYECIVGEWWLRRTSDKPSKEEVLQAVVSYNGNGIVESNKKIEVLEAHYVGNNEKWIEPAYSLPSFTPAVQIIPLENELIAPELSSGNQTVKYNDVLHSDEILIIGPGLKAELKPKPLFSEKTCNFECTSPDGAVYDKDYLVYRTPRVNVKPGQKFSFKLTGKADNGGNSLVIINFTCGKEKKDVSVFGNKFNSEMKTYEKDVVVPEFGGKGQISLEMWFYRLNQKGSVTYKKFSLTAQDPPVDVSSKLQGRLGALEKFFTIWQFKDNSESDYLGKPKTVVRFFNPDEANAVNDITSLPYF